MASSRAALLVAVLLLLLVSSLSVRAEADQVARAPALAPDVAAASWVQQGSQEAAAPGRPGMGMGKNGAARWRRTAGARPGRGRRRHRRVGVLGDAAPWVRTAVGIVGVPQRHAGRRRRRGVLRVRRWRREPVIVDDDDDEDGRVRSCLPGAGLVRSTNEDPVPRAHSRIGWWVSSCFDSSPSRLLPCSWICKKAEKNFCPPKMSAYTTISWTFQLCKLRSSLTALCSEPEWTSERSFFCLPLFLRTSSLLLFLLLNHLIWY